MSRRRAGRCPICGVGVAVPQTFVGTWTGAKREGGPAGGGVYETRCRLCRVPLVAYGDCYDDEGRIVAEPELAWSLRGVPWQTIGIVFAAAVAAWCWFR